jgi:hypothetical protein
MILEEVEGRTLFHPINTSGMPHLGTTSGYETPGAYVDRISKRSDVYRLRSKGGYGVTSTHTGVFVAVFFADSDVRWATWTPREVVPVMMDVWRPRFESGGGGWGGSDEPPRARGHFLANSGRRRVTWMLLDAVRMLDGLPGVGFEWERRWWWWS